VRVRPAVRRRVGRIRFFTHGTKANLSDDKGLIEMLSNNIDYFKSKLVNIPKITILIDNGYHPEKLKEELEQIYSQIMSKIRFKLSPKPSKVDKKNKGFNVGANRRSPLQISYVLIFPSTAIV
jgi:hypothetical protein